MRVMQTKRLALREMHMGDLSNLARIFTDPIAMKYYQEMKNKEETIRWITWTMNNYKKFGVGLWVVVNKETGDFLGQCGLVPQKVDGKVEMEIGYLFVRTQWGKGYATEAASACKDYGFDTLKIDKLVSLIDQNNLASVNVAERIGMKKEKVIQKWGKDLSLYTISALND